MELKCNNPESYGGHSVTKELSLPCTRCEQVINLPTEMLKNYLQITLRNIRRHKGYSFINIFGLAAGMAAFILIVLFVQNELSFDSMHEHRADVYRVLVDAEVGGQSFVVASSPAILATQFLDTFPEIEAATRINDRSADVLIKVDNKPYYQSGFFEADSSVFDVFTFPLLSGNAATALNRPNTIVLSESVARKYFGDQDPIGKTVQYDNRIDYEVTAVMQDVAHNSHFRPELIASFLTHSQVDSPIWLSNSFYTYLRLNSGFAPGDLEAKFPEFMRTYVGPQIEQFMGTSYDEALASGFRYDWRLEKMTDIYLYSDSLEQIGNTGDIRYLYILGIIALFVLAIACINFMNLSTARATGRAREVGIRKTLGSDRGQLIRQFLGESVTTALISMVIAFALVLVALPYFSATTGATLSITPWLIGVMTIVAILTGLVAGLYPAFVLSSFEPALVLKGSFARSQQGSFLRSTLVVFQFGISIVLLVGTSVVYKQLSFLQNQDLGFEKEHVVVVPVETSNGVQTFDTFRNQLLSYSGIVDVAAAGLLPGPDHVHNNTAFRGEGMRQAEFFIAASGEVSDDYVETLGLKIIAGRDFDRKFSDSTSFVINEAAAAKIGMTPEKAVGTLLTRPSGNPDDTDRVATIIGVVQNANYASMHTQVQPMVLGRWVRNQRYVPIRIRPENVEATLDFIEEKWTKWEAGYPFRFYFMDADYELYYEQEKRLGNLYTYFTILAIVIACLGLFGLSSFITSQRTKEIGVRKVMGASVTGIVVLLSKEFTYLVLIACALAFPVAWYAMDLWLQDFAYATTMGWEVFVVSGLSALVVAWLTVSYQSIKAATSNPVDALHYE